MSARNGRIDMTAATPWGVAGNLGLAWRMPSETLLTWDALLDLAVVAYWTRRRALSATSTVATPCENSTRSEATSGL